MKFLQEKINTINQLLPQTQCQGCGYKGCLPYAKALANNEAEINLCVPGQEEVMLDLANLLHKPPRAVEPSLNQTVYIDELICIGCKACVRACPVDAIVGTTKKMHTVINQECTGCQLCVPVCPVDCIHPLTENIDYLPKNTVLSNALNPRIQASQHAKNRFENHQKRLKRQEQTKQTLMNNKNNIAHNLSQLVIQNILHKAKNNVAHRKLNRIQIQDEDHLQHRILAEQKQASYRKAQKDFRYGSQVEKTKALQFLQQYKEEQKPNKGN